MTQESVTIEFPCEYPVKVLGRARADFQPVILEVFELHAPGFDAEGIQVRASSGGRFISITVTIFATGPQQLTSLHEALMETGLVSMVL